MLSPSPRLRTREQSTWRVKIQRGGRRCTEFQSSQFILPHLQTYRLDGKEREGERERGRARKGKRNEAKGWLCSPCMREEVRTRRGRKERKLSAVIALVGVQIARRGWSRRRKLFLSDQKGVDSGKVPVKWWRCWSMIFVFRGEW